MRFKRLLICNVFICRALQTVVNCLSPVVNLCPDDDMRRQFTAGLDITEFLCGDEGKSRKYRCENC
jgi:hypothetical protein